MYLVFSLVCRGLQWVDVFLSRDDRDMSYDRGEDGWGREGGGGGGSLLRPNYLR